MTEESECGYIKYHFEVVYQSKQMKQVSDFLEKCDMLTGVLCMKEIIKFRYTKEEKPIAYFKDLIRQAMESVENTVLKIEGGKIE